MNHIETDYLIIGAGAMSLAFADELLASSRDVHLTIVERRSAPGGHWVDAYPFVRLHQPAIGYGVNSARLGSGGEDLSSRSEILAYYERVIARMLATGRVSVHFTCEVDADGDIVSLLDDRKRIAVTVRRRVVDGGYMKVEVPATHPPRYAVDDDVTLVPPNALARMQSSSDRYVVIGAGKTGIDSVLFLLDHGVRPDRIQWILSADIWMWNRAHVQRGQVGEELLSFVRAIAEEDDLASVYRRLERQGSLLRLSSDVEPRRWRCATVSVAELEKLRRVTDQVRLGRVQRISRHQVLLDGGTLPVAGRSVFVDCTANGLTPRTPKPIFAPERITLQSVYMCQQVLSAAVIARMESMAMEDAERNALWSVVPHPNDSADMPELMVRTMKNLLAAQPAMGWWLWRARLNILSHDGSLAYLRAAIQAMRWVRRAEARLPALVPPRGGSDEPLAPAESGHRAA